jgi:hypothetical protein
VSSRASAALLIACGLALRAGAAAGQTPPAATGPPPLVAPPSASDATAATVEHWYGWQTLIVDAGAVGLTTLGLGLAVGAGHDLDKAALGIFYTGLGAFVFGGPIVHVAHGHWAKAGYSLALRLGLPVLLWAAGFFSVEGSCGNPDGGCGGAAIGGFTFLTGVALATMLDAGLIARERVPAPARKVPFVAFTPLRDGGGLSLVGRF